MRRTATIAVAGALSLLLAACGGTASTISGQPTQVEETTQDEDAKDKADEAEDEAQDTSDDKTKDEDAKESADKDADEAEEPSWASQVAWSLTYGEMVTEKREGESLLVGLLKSLDWERGVHMVYEHHDDHEKYGTDDYVEVNAKGGSYFEATEKTLTAYGIKSNDGKAFVDGVYYKIETDSSTAKSYPDSISSQIDNPLAIDDLYKVAIMEAMYAGDAYTTEKREYEGKTYTAEVYPSPDEYIPTTTFLFDKDGKLAYCLRDPLDKANVGNAVYIIKTIDGNVDESLFDLSGYTIKKIEI